MIIAAIGLNANKATKVKSKKPKLDKKLSGALVSTELAVETSFEKTDSNSPSRCFLK